MTAAALVACACTAILCGVLYGRILSLQARVEGLVDVMKQQNEINRLLINHSKAMNRIVLEASGPQDEVRH